MEQYYKNDKIIIYYLLLKNYIKNSTNNSIVLSYDNFDTCYTLKPAEYQFPDTDFCMKRITLSKSNFTKCP
jgi:hypothetical protein